MTACCGGKDKRNSIAFVVANSSIVVEEANSRSLPDQLYLPGAGVVNAAAAKGGALRMLLCVDVKMKPVRRFGYGFRNG